MNPPVVIYEKDLLKKPEESTLEQDDLQNIEKYRVLDKKKKRSEDEEAEYKQLDDKVIAKYMLSTGGLPKFFADTDLKRFVSRIHEELASQYILDTPLKRILVDRVTSAWSLAHSYERMFRMTKYKTSEDGTYLLNFSKDRTEHLKEIRKGMESANDQILRLTQALQNLVQPQIHVKATNAFFAQNQQVNQAVIPKDLDKNSEPNNNEKTTP